MKGKTTKSNQQRILVTLPRDLWRKFRIAAIEKDMTATALLHKVLEEYLQIPPAPTGKKPKEPPQEKIFG